MPRSFSPTPKALLKPLYRVVREEFFKRKYSKNRKGWIRNYAKSGVLIDETLSLTGREEPYAYINLNSGILVEKDVTIWIAPYQDANPTLSLGAESYVGRNVFFNVYYPITIGALVQIAPYCYFTSANHGHTRRDVPMKHQDFYGAPITIGDDV